MVHFFLVASFMSVQTEQIEFPGSVKYCDKRLGNLGFKTTFWAFFGKMWQVANPQGSVLTSILSSSFKKDYIDPSAGWWFI